ncbi:MAG: hypothetical protein HFJ94_00720 [Muribaculaceae bacterium]|nr:hypothetical protein [Muribaculaceae bacterium]
MKQRFITLIAIIVILATSAYIGMVFLSSQDNLTAERTQGPLGILPLRGNPLEAEVIPGLRFKIDTGSDISTITRKDLDLLDSLGFTVNESFYPVFGRDGNGKILFETKRYSVQLPLLNYTFYEDSLGNRNAVGSWSTANILSNVDFAPSRTGQSVLGIDFLQKFAIEYLYNNRAIALYLTPPEGYDKCLDLTPSMSVFTSLWLGKRYFSDFTVNGETYSFFLDTGIRNALIKLPADANTSSSLRADTVSSALGSFEALVDDRAYIEMGNRLVNGSAYYYDSREEHYAFNPLNLFLQDILIDFAGGSISLRPIYNKLTTTPGLVTTVTTIP